jgi:hypothetical protein
MNLQVIPMDYGTFLSLRGVSDDSLLPEKDQEVLGQIIHFLNEKFRKINHKPDRPKHDHHHRTGGKSGFKQRQPASSTNTWNGKAPTNTIQKTINLILNSLTDSNISSVVSRLKKCMEDMTSDTLISVLIPSIITSAMMQCTYVGAFASVCVSLHDYNPSFLDHVREILHKEYIHQMTQGSISKAQCKSLSYFLSALYIKKSLPFEEFRYFIDPFMQRFVDTKDELSIEIVMFAIEFVLEKGGESADCQESMLSILNNLADISKDKTIPKYIFYKILNIMEKSEDLKNRLSIPSI